MTPEREKELLAENATLKGEVLTALNDLEYERITSHNLRTRLDALVTAVRGFADRNYTFIDNTCAVSYKDIRLLRDALAAAVAAAKDHAEKEGV